MVYTENIEFDFLKYAISTDQFSHFLANHVERDILLLWGKSLAV